MAKKCRFWEALGKFSWKQLKAVGNECFGRKWMLWNEKQIRMVENSCRMADMVFWGLTMREWKQLKAVPNSQIWSKTHAICQKHASTVKTGAEHWKRVVHHRNRSRCLKIGDRGWNWVVTVKNSSKDWMWVVITKTVTTWSIWEYLLSCMSES